MTTTQIIHNIEYGQGGENNPSGEKKQPFQLFRLSLEFLHRV